MERGHERKLAVDLQGVFVPGVSFLIFLGVLFASTASPTALAQTSINFVQVNSSTPKSASSLTVAYSSAQTAGDLNVVAVGWSDATNTVTSVSDSKGNSYKLAVNQASSSLSMTHSIYYASNVVAASAGTNTVTVKFSASVSYPDVRVLEYTGVNTLEKTASAGGNASTADSGGATTTVANELLFGANYTFGSTNAAGSGYTARIIDSDGDIAEDDVVSSTGTYHATAAMSGNNWIMQLATFYNSSSGSSAPPAPTNLTATAASSSQINLSWTASSGATTYNVLRSTTNGGPYSQIASGVTTTSYSDTGLTASTTYYYVVQAVNSAGPSGNSNQASATTPSGGTPPPAPTTLTATAVSSSQINLSWTASSGATSYNVLRSTTNGGPYSQIASGVTTTSYSDTGLAASTSYYYVVQAVNSAGTSGNSNQASATTNAASGVSVSISPSSATVATNEVLVLTATVSGSSNTGVQWQVNGAAGGSVTYGVISTTVLGTTSEALYLAPASVPSGSVTVTAVSLASSSASASASVAVQLPSRSGVTYYVSTTGSDSNSGTSGAPFRTIQHAANTAQPGDTVQVMGGTYNELVTIPNSGNATSGYITFMSYPGQTAIVDGTGLSLSGQQGLFSLEGTHGYIIIEGFEIRNYQGSSRNQVPVGIDFEGAGSYIQFLNNHIHNIVISGSSCTGANGLGVAVYGNQAPASIDHLTFLGNEVDHNTTGCSENVSFDGNVQYFVEANNKVHDGNNIGLDNIGFESVSPNSGYDQARDGWVFQNQIYSITSTTNPVYHYKVGADGYYCDGCARVIVERNLIHDVDLSELASEHSGHTSSYVLFRNNVIYNSLYVGLSIGGYSSGVGGTDHCMLVNNTLWNDGTYGSSGLGELQIQYYATNNTIENNIVDNYTINKQLLYDFTSSEPSPAVLDYNQYWSTNGAASSLWDWQGKSITGYSLYQSTSSMDAHSPFADPQFLNLSSTPPNLDVWASSPAVNAGTNLGVNVVGVLDYAGNPRVNSSGQINLGAYEQ